MDRNEPEKNIATLNKNEEKRFEQLFNEFAKMDSGSMKFHEFF